MSDSREYYDSIAGEYDKLRSWGSLIPGRIVKVGEISGGRKVLDLGCGTGNLTSAVKNLSGCVPYGLDTSRGMLKIAKEKVGGGAFVRGTVSDMPFPDEFFDCVIGALFVHHLTPPLRKKTMEESYRVLSRGRLVIQTISDRLVEKSGYAEFFPEILEVASTDFPKISEIEDLLRDAGFRDVISETVHDKPVNIDMVYLMAKSKVISAMDKITPGAHERGLKRLRLCMKADPNREFESPMTVVYGEKGQGL